MVKNTDHVRTGRVLLYPNPIRGVCSVPRKKRLVGWPPVKCARRSGGGGGYVKVKMEGVAIGRKVDVSLHGSFQDLLRTLRRMFPPATQRGA